MKALMTEVAFSKVSSFWGALVALFSVGLISCEEGFFVMALVFSKLCTCFFAFAAVSGLLQVCSLHFSISLQVLWWLFKNGYSDVSELGIPVADFVD